MAINISIIRDITWQLIVYRLEAGISIKKKKFNTNETLH